MASLRYALRFFLSHRGPLLTGILSLGVAYGLSGAIASVTRAWLLPTVGLPRPAEIYTLAIDPSSPRARQTALNCADLRILSTAAPEVQIGGVIDGTRRMEVGAPSSPEPIAAQFVNSQFFAATESRAAFGRLFGANDQSAAVISHAVWQRIYGGSREALGSVIRIDEQPFTVVGVAVPGLTGPFRTRPAGVWLPIEAWAGGNPRADLDGAFPTILVRMPSPDARHRFEAQASAAIGASRGLDPLGDGRAKLVPLSLSSTDLRARSALPILGVLTSLLVIIGTLNLAGVLMSIASTRHHEFAVRSALGATHWAIVRQLLVESLAIGVTGTLASLITLKWFSAAVASLIHLPIDVPLEASLGLDGVILVSGIVLALAAGWLSGRQVARAEGAAPFRTIDVVSVLKPHVTRSVMVACQLGVCLVLLVTGATWARGAAGLRGASPGYDLDSILYVQGRTFGGDWNQTEARSYWQEAFAALSRQPAVDRASLLQHMFASGYERASIPKPDGGRLIASLNRTASNYFETVGIRLIAGRSYSDGEAFTDAPVAVVSERLAGDLWGGATKALGQTVVLPDGPARLTVIGVVADVLGTNITELANPLGALYRPLSPMFVTDAALVVHLRRPASVAEIAAALPMSRARKAPQLARLSTVFQQQVRLGGVPARLALFCALFVLVLALTGLEGLVYMMVRYRTRDIAVRISVGAAPRNVALYVVGLAWRPVVCGCVLGALGAALALRSLPILAFGRGLIDAGVIAIAAGVLLAVIAAGTARALRFALRLSPTDALRV